MLKRVKLLQGAAALLYMGPLLAGLGGYGWSLVPLFVAIFVLWLMVLRPQEWPRDPAAWAVPGQIVGALTRIVVQVLLVAVCFGIGRGIGGVMGFVPLFHPALPVALSFLSIPLARLIWDPWKAEEMDRFLDEAIVGISRAGRGDHGPDAAHIAEGTRKAHGLLDRLADLGGADLGGDAGEQAILTRLREMERLVDPERISDALFDRACRDDAGPAMYRTLAIFATDGRLAEILGGDLPTRALAILPREPGVIGLYLRRAIATIEQDEDMVWSFPAPETLDLLAIEMVEAGVDLEVGAGADVAAAISRLTALTVSLTRPEDGAADGAGR